MGAAISTVLSGLEEFSSGGTMGFSLLPVALEFSLTPQHIMVWRRALTLPVVLPLTRLESIALLPPGSTGNEELVNRPFLSPFQTLSLGSFPDGHVKNIPWICEMFHNLACQVGWKWPVTLTHYSLISESFPVRIRIWICSWQKSEVHAASSSQSFF